MIRLLIHVEGETEETFVADVLAPHLYGLGYVSVASRLMGSAQLREQRGGVRAWESVRKEIIDNLVGDSELIVSTMVDYYGMPNDWPDRSGAAAPGLSADERAVLIEGAMLEDVRIRMDGNFNPNRFVPYVMMHEFEAMLFSDCKAFGTAIGHSDLSAGFQAVRDRFDSPEEIDDSPITAPSKRIEAILPAYQKLTMGVQATQEIGIDAIRSECPHFRDWLYRLEGLPNQ